MDVCYAKPGAQMQLRSALRIARQAQEQQQQQQNLGWGFNRQAAPLTAIVSFGMQALFGAQEQSESAKAQETDASDLTPRQNAGLSPHRLSPATAATDSSPVPASFHGESGWHIEAVATSPAQKSHNSLPQANPISAAETHVKELQMAQVGAGGSSSAKGMFARMICVICVHTVFESLYTPELHTQSTRWHYSMCG